VKVGDLVKVRGKYQRTITGLIVDFAHYDDGTLYGYIVVPTDGNRAMISCPEDVKVISESR